MNEVATLIEAVQQNDTTTVHRLLTARPTLAHRFAVQPRAHGEEHWLALHYAAEGGRYDAAAALLDHGAQPDARTRFRTPYHGRATALHLAAGAGHTAIVDLLLNRGASLEVRDAAERAPLTRAVRGGHRAVTDLLLEAGAMVDPPDTRGQTPLHEAVGANDLEPEVVEKLVAQLIRHGADVNRRCPRDSDAFTPLHRCVGMGAVRTAVARRLLDAGADPALADPAHGWTPLALARWLDQREPDARQPLIALLTEPPRPRVASHAAPHQHD